MGLEQQEGETMIGSLYNSDENNSKCSCHNFVLKKALGVSFRTINRTKHHENQWFQFFWLLLLLNATVLNKNCFSILNLLGSMGNIT